MANLSFLRASDAAVAPGIAVSAGELEEENAKTLARTRQERDQALMALRQAQEEIQTLRVRVSSLEGNSVTP